MTTPKALQARAIAILTSKQDIYCKYYIICTRHVCVHMLHVKMYKKKIQIETVRVHTEHDIEIFFFFLVICHCHVQKVCTCINSWRSVCDRNCFKKKLYYFPLTTQ